MMYEERHPLGSEVDVYQLWQDTEKPFFKESDVEEYEETTYDVTYLYQIVEPTLSVYPAQGENTGTAVMIIPGGGYQLVAIEHEGHDLAKVMAKHGITAGVLKYRLPDPRTSTTPELVPLSDARRALALFRDMTHQYGFGRDTVGVVGFSAGSHLCAVMNFWPSEKRDEMPDFTGFIYGVSDLNSHNQSWLEEHLYHRSMNPEEIRKNTLLNLVDENSRPAFIVHACDDEICAVSESWLLAQAYMSKGLPVEFHLFPQGHHGFGMGSDEYGTIQWVTLFMHWLGRLG